jgi:hypothetical protein
MTPAKICTILVVPLLSFACAQSPDSHNARAANMAGSINQAEAAPANTATPETPPANATAAAAGPLSVYVGKLTYDSVAGSTFVARSEVRAAVESLVPDAGARRWILNPDTTQSPIALRGGRLYSGACEPHNCGPHQWTIEIAPDGSSPEICYHDDRQDPSHSRWYAAGRAPETRPGYCQTA